MVNSKNWAFWTGIVIPIAMILLVAGSIYWPRSVLPPKTNFLYIIQQNPTFTANKDYEVQQETLIQREINQSSQTKTKFYIYNVVNNQSTEISFSEAQKLKLDSNAQSPDGFKVLQGKRNVGGPFDFYPDPPLDYSAYYLTKNNTVIKVNIPPQNNHGNYYLFRFLGWIKNYG